MESFIDYAIKEFVKPYLRNYKIGKKSELNRHIYEECVSTLLDNMSSNNEDTIPKELEFTRYDEPNFILFIKAYQNNKKLSEKIVKKIYEQSNKKK